MRTAVLFIVLIIAVYVDAQSYPDMCRLKAADGTVLINNIYNPATNSLNWVDIPSTQWSLVANPADPATYPLGFRQGMLYTDNNPAFCVTATNVRNRKVEVMVETFQPMARICVRDADQRINMANGRILQRCGYGRLYACFDAPTTSNDLAMIIYCDEACRSSDTAFWYRVVVSSNDWTSPTGMTADGSNIEMWCDMRRDLNTTAFPSELANDFPPGFQFQQVEMPPARQSSAVHQAVFSMGLVAILSLMAVVLF